MGYRSNGAVYLSNEALFMLPPNLKHDLQTAWIKDNDTPNIYYFEGWKWYNDIPEIREWEDFFDKLEDEEVSYDFIRIGEDIEDSEVRKGDVFYLERNIGIY